MRHLKKYGIFITIAVIILSIVLLSLLSVRDTKDNTKDLSIYNQKRVIMALGTTPNTGLYPNKENYMYEQVEGMILELSERFSMDAWQIRVIYRMLNLNPIYTDKAPNIYTDLSVNELYTGNKFQIISYQDIVKNKVEPSNRRLADVMYSAVKAFDTFEIKNTLENEDIINDIEVKYLSEKDKHYIKFALNILDFFDLKSHKETFCSDYKRITNIMVGGSNTTKLLYSDRNKNAKFNSKAQAELFDETYSEEYINILANVLSGNDALINNGTFIDLNYSGVNSSEYPYRYLYFSRENMMRAAISVVGKVRYVWGGGHLGGGQIAGINPLWERFNDIYHLEEQGRCIKPSGTWCPVHSGGSNCAFYKPYVHTVEDYISAWKKQMQDAGYGNILYGINEEEIYSLFRGRNTVSQYSSQSVELHRFDGLDCSGFASWLYNQVDASSVKDALAPYLVDCKGMREVSFGERLYPGDALGWDTHIVIVFGQYSKDCYITVEQTPNELKFGACAFNNGTAKLDEAGEYAKKLNKHFGVADDDINKFNFNNYRSGRKFSIARSERKFLDEDRKISGYNRSFEDLNAQEILEVLGYDIH